MKFSNLNELLNWAANNQNSDWDSEGDIMVGEMIFPTVYSALEAFVI